MSRFRSAGLVSKFVETDTDGTTMHCWVPKREPAGPVLVMLHGFGSTAVWQWYKQNSALQPFFNVYVPDLFFGQSFTPKEERLEIFQAECVMELMRSLEVPEFSLLGTSYGGFVTFRMAHMFPAAVKRVIISNSAILMTPEDYVNLASRGNVLTVVDLLVPASPNALLAASTLVFHRPLRLPHFLLQDFWSVLYTSNRKEKEELVQGVVLGTEPALPVPLLQQEVLVIWGEHDRFFLSSTPTNCKGLRLQPCFVPTMQTEKERGVTSSMNYSQVPFLGEYKIHFFHVQSTVRRHLGERAQLAVVKNAAHVPQLEQPTEFNGLVKAFLLH